MVHNTSLTGVCASVAALIAALSAPAAHAADDVLTGDVGLAGYWSQSIVKDAKRISGAIPYLNFEYGRLFARVDTFGVKVLPLGYGHVELVAQLRGDGYEAPGMQKRRGSAPVGVGTLQVTPVGAFIFNALYDAGESDGALWQARYLAQFALGRFEFFPEIGVEKQGRNYTRYYYGTTPAEAVAFGRDYRPGAAVNSYVGLMIETRLTDHWYLHTYARRTFLADAISASPFVSKKTQNAVLIGAGYRF